MAEPLKWKWDQHESWGAWELHQGATYHGFLIFDAWNLASGNSYTGNAYVSARPIAEAARELVRLSTGVSI